MRIYKNIQWSNFDGYELQENSDWVILTKNNKVIGQILFEDFCSTIEPGQILRQYKKHIKNKNL